MITDLIKKLFTKTFIKFVLTGVLNTAVGYLLYAAAFYITGNKPVSLAVDYVLSIFFNFKTYSVLVFNSHDNRKIYSFVGVYIFVYFLNWAILSLICNVFKLNAYFGQAIALTIVPVVLFFLMGHFVFHTNKSTKD